MLELFEEWLAEANQEITIAKEEISKLCDIITQDYASRLLTLEQIFMELESERGRFEVNE